MNPTSPLDGFVVDRAAIGSADSELQRPECILAECDGTRWAAEARGGVTRFDADGSQRTIGQRRDARFAAAAGEQAAQFEARFTQGTLFDRIGGQSIGKVSFVLRDSRHRIGLTVSPRVNPWTAAAASRVRDGFHFTNEVRLDAREQWLNIVETTGPHITRIPFFRSPAPGLPMVHW